MVTPGGWKRRGRGRLRRPTPVQAAQRRGRSPLRRHTASMQVAL